MRAMMRRAPWHATCSTRSRQFDLAWLEGSASTLVPLQIHTALHADSGGEADLNLIVHAATDGLIPTVRGFSVEGLVPFTNGV